MKKYALVSQEWPKDCDLFGELVYLRSQKQIGLSYTAMVKRCCIDGVRKEWKFKTNHPELAANLMTPPCHCESPETFPISASGFYSQKVAQHIIEAFTNVKL